MVLADAQYSVGLKTKPSDAMCVPTLLEDVSVTSLVAIFLSISLSLHEASPNQLMAKEEVIS